MAIFTMDIDRLPVFAFSECTIGEARAFASRSSLLRELAKIVNADGNPLWNAGAGVSVRFASDEEVSRWRRSFERSIAAGEIAPDEHIFGVFLVSVAFPAPVGL